MNYHATAQSWQPENSFIPQQQWTNSEQMPVNEHRPASSNTTFHPSHPISQPENMNAQYSQQTQDHNGSYQQNHGHYGPSQQNQSHVEPYQQFQGHAQPYQQFQQNYNNGYGSAPSQYDSGSAPSQAVHQQSWNGSSHGVYSYNATSSGQTYQGSAERYNNNNYNFQPPVNTGHVISQGHGYGNANTGAQHNYSAANRDGTVNQASWVWTGRPAPPDYICHNCSQKGHWIEHCPARAANAPGKAQPPYEYTCFKCGIKGHWIESCTKHLGHTGADQSTTHPPQSYVCHKCGIAGHWIESCPTTARDGRRIVPRVNNATKSASGSARPDPSIGYTCRRCGIKGHWMELCPNTTSRKTNVGQPENISTENTSRRGKACHRCGAKGHRSEACQRQVSSHIPLVIVCRLLMGLPNHDPDDHANHIVALRLTTASRRKHLHVGTAVSWVMS